MHFIFLWKIYIFILHVCIFRWRIPTFLTFPWNVVSYLLNKFFLPLFLPTVCLLVLQRTLLIFVVESVCIFYPRILSKTSLNIIIRHTFTAHFIIKFVNVATVHEYTADCKPWSGCKLWVLTHVYGPLEATRPYRIFGLRFYDACVHFVPKSWNLISHNLKREEKCLLISWTISLCSDILNILRRYEVSWT